jgi:flagellar hook-length control protein FliK
MSKFADHRVAQVAAVISTVAKASAPTASAPPSFGDDFAQVLAGLAPRSEAKDAPQPAAHPHDALQVAQAKPIAEKAKLRVPALIMTAKADAKPDVKIKMPDAKAELAAPTPKEAAPESDDTKDVVTAVTALQPLDSSKIALAVRAFLASDTSKVVSDTPKENTDTSKAAASDTRAPVAATAVAATPSAAAPVVSAPVVANDGRAQPIQVHDAKPVTPEALAEIMAVAKNTNAPSDDAKKLKADAGRKLPENVSVKVANTLPTTDTVKAQPKPQEAPPSQPKAVAAMPAANDKTARVIPDTASAPQDQPKDTADSDTGGTQQQSASSERHDAPQADQVPAAAKTVPAPQQPQAVAQAVAAAAPAVAAPTAVTVTQATQPSPQASADAPSSLQNLGTAIAVKAAGGTKSFEIRLDPAELGRVEVKLDIGSDGKADATITVHRPETLALMLSDSQNLERSLRDAGLDVSNSSLNFSLKGDGRQGDGGGASGAPRRNLPNSVVARSEAANAAIASQSLASPNARLDIRV